MEHAQKHPQHSDPRADILDGTLIVQAQKEAWEVGPTLEMSWEDLLY